MKWRIVLEVFPSMQKAEDKTVPMDFASKPVIILKYLHVGEDGKDVSAGSIESARIEKPNARDSRTPLRTARVAECEPNRRLREQCQIVILDGVGCIQKVLTLSSIRRQTGIEVIVSPPVHVVFV